MLKIRSLAPELVGLTPVGIGAIGLARWQFGADSFGQSLFGFPALGLGAPVLLLVCSATFFYRRYQNANGAKLARASARQVSLMTAGPAFVGMVALAMLFEHVTGISVGVDVHARDAVATAANPFPGRMSANACIGFLCLSLAMISNGGRAKGAVPYFIAGAALVAASGLVGRILHFEHLYRWGASNQLTAQVALGIGLLAASFWLDWDQSTLRGGEVGNHERQITRRSIVVLTLIAIGAGTGGFAVVQSLYDESQAQHLSLTAEVNAESMSYSLDMASWLVKAASTRPVVTETLARLNARPGDPAARAFLEKVDQSFVTAGLDGMSFRTLSGEVVTAGRLTLTGIEPELDISKAYPGSKLAFSTGYIFATEMPVLDHGRLVGSLVAEQHLALIEDLVAKLRASAATTDVLLCGRSGESAICFPSRFYTKAFSIPLFSPDGQPSRLISRSVLGQSGVDTNTDLNGSDVIAAYRPLGRSGLGMAVKTNVDTYYAAMRGRLLQLLVIMGGLIALGTVALRSQVRPLVARLASEQRRSWAILQNSNDAFVSLDRHGCVDAWNVEASKTFGWTAAEAIGRKLSELIIPPESREAHERGMARFTQSGTGPVVNHRIELAALHRDGHSIPIELSVAATDMGGYFTATAFLRDITARKRTEHAIAQGERRLRLVTDNMPALISHVDLDYRYSLVNAHYCGWFSRPESDFVGKTVSEVFGPAVFEGAASNLKCNTS